MDVNFLARFAHNCTSCSSLRTILHFCAQDLAASNIKFGRVFKFPCMFYRH